MFHVSSDQLGATNRLAIIGLLTLSVVALGVTVWIMIDFLREQEIVQSLIQQLPDSAKPTAELLAGELRWQFRLTILVVLNVVVAAIAMTMLWRAYQISQESLRDFKALAADILSSMEQGVITTDPFGTVTSINRRGAEMLSISEEVIGKPLAELSHAIPLDDLRKQAKAADPFRYTQDFRLVRNGNPRTLQAFCQPLRDHEDAEIGNVLQLTDVSERVLLDERMRRMERYMGLGSLAAGLHHEIKNPLAALSLHVQLLEEEIGAEDSDAEVCKMLDVIKTEVKRIGAVLENFRDFASLGNLNCSHVDVAELVEKQATLLKPRADRQGIQLQFSRADNDIPLINADRVRIEQVLLNLLINAMEAMPNGGQLSTKVSTCEESGQRWLRIEVADNGCGIPDNVRDRIFDPYFTTKNEGTGMGLAICDKIIRQHQGRLDCQSSDHGTLFTIDLPIDEISVPDSSHQ